jgi:hypothetical protein
MPAPASRDLLDGTPGGWPDPGSRGRETTHPMADRATDRPSEQIKAAQPSQRPEPAEGQAKSGSAQTAPLFRDCASI